MIQLNPIVREALTPREAEIAEQLLHGKTNKEIAAVLGIDPRTVKSHFRDMYQRFQIGARLVDQPRGKAGKRILLTRELLGRA